METQRLTIDTELDRALTKLNELEIDSEDYARAVKNYQALLDAKKRIRVSPDILVGAATNILGILLVLNYEKLGVISSRALMFIKRSS